MKHLFFGCIHPKYKKEMSTQVTDLETIVPQEVVIPMTPVEENGFNPMDETDERLQDIVNKVA